MAITKRWNQFEIVTSNCHRASLTVRSLDMSSKDPIERKGCEGFVVRQDEKLGNVTSSKIVGSDHLK